LAKAALISRFGLGRKLVVELKALTVELGAPEKQQLKNYMKLLNVKTLRMGF
jgi:hypothetical protein